MSRDPFDVLGVTPADDDAAVRGRYLELVRRHPPESDPARFAAVRSAYEAVSDREKRTHFLLLERGRSDGLDRIIEELSCRLPRPRVTLTALLAARDTP